MYTKKRKYTPKKKNYPVKKVKTKKNG